LKENSLDYEVNVNKKNYSGKEVENQQSPGLFLRHYAPNLPSYIIGKSLDSENS